MQFETQLNNMTQAANAGDWQQVSKLDTDFRHSIESLMEHIQASDDQQAKIDASENLSQSLLCYKTLIEKITEQQKQIGDKVRELRVGKRATKSYYNA